MTTEVDYILVCKVAADPRSLVQKALALAYEDDYASTLDENQLNNAVKIRYDIKRPDDRRITGLSIEFETEPERMNAVIDLFNRELSGSSDEGFKHLLKFHDTDLFERNMNYAKDIFHIEMRLREVLSFIFLDTFADDFHAVGNYVEVKTGSGEKLENVMLNKRLENALFYVLFGEYAACNKNSHKADIKTIVELLQFAKNFDTLQEWWTAKPIRKTAYSDFITSLGSIMSPLEKVRNCVAHNRAIPTDLIANYETAKGNLLKFIDDFVSTKIADEPNEEEANLMNNTRPQRKKGRSNYRSRRPRK